MTWTNDENGCFLMTIIESNGSDKKLPFARKNEWKCVCDENRIFEYFNAECSQLNAFNVVPNRAKYDNGSMNNSQTKRSSKMLSEKREEKNAHKLKCSFSSCFIYANNFSVLIASPNSHHIISAINEQPALLEYVLFTQKKEMKMINVF